MLARRAMTLARAPCTDGTRADLIHREQRPRLVRAARPVPRAHEALRLVGAAQMRRAVRLAARRADAHVLVTSRLSIHPALGDAVVRAEVLGAYRATVRARLAGAVVVPADDKQRRRATALRARHAPGRRTGRAQGPLGAEGGVMPAGRGRLEPPLGALYQDVGLDQL